MNPVPMGPVLPIALPSRPGGRPEGQQPSTPEPVLGSVDPLEVSLAPTPAFLGLAADVAGPPAAGRTAGYLPAVDAALVEQVVRRIVWGGDRRRGVARIELDGELAGTSIALRGEGRELEIDLVLGPGLESGGLAERLLARLRTRGIVVARCDVR